MNNWIKLKSYYDKSEAEIDKGFLESVGIQVFVKGMELSGARPYLNATNPIEILIDPKYLDRAKKIIEDNG